MSKRHKRPRHTTDAQRAAARANGAKSHGPATDEGKAKSAMNALRHGLCVSTLLLNNEDRDKVNQLLDRYIEEFQPATQSELDLVEQMTASKWLLQRCWTLEAATLDFAMDEMRPEMAKTIESTDEPTRAALAFMKSVDESNAVAQLNRYAARHSREWHKNLDKLRAIQQERTQAQHTTAHEVSGQRSGSSTTCGPELAVLQNEPENAITPIPPAAYEPPRAPEVLAVN